MRSRFASTSLKSSRNTLALKPSLYAIDISGLSQNLAWYSPRSTWMWVGSRGLPSFAPKAPAPEI